MFKLQFLTGKWIHLFLSKLFNTATTLTLVSLPFIKDDDLQEV